MGWATGPTPTCMSVVYLMLIVYIYSFIFLFISTVRNVVFLYLFIYLFMALRGSVTAVKILLNELNIPLQT